MGLIDPNRMILRAVAAKIRPLLDDVVFVGGQVVELYLTDKAAVRVRATKDVDVVMAGSRLDYHKTEERLRELGFYNDKSEGAPVCRWRTDDGYILDLMPVDDTILGFSNEWYAAAVDKIERFALDEEIVISIPRAPIFVATKLAAFLGRGKHDLLGSHDLEDVINIVAGRPEIVAELRQEPNSVKRYVAEQFKNLIDHPDFAYALPGALPDAGAMPEYRDEVRGRFELVAAMKWTEAL